MQVLGAGQVYEEKEDCADVKPPEDAVQDGIGTGIQTAEQWVEPGANGRPGAAIVGGSHAVGCGVGGVFKTLDQCQC